MKTNLSLLRLNPYWYLLLLSFFVLNSCKSKDAVKSNDDTAITDTMKMATIVDYSEKSDACSFLIELEKEELVLQALEIPKEFMKDGEKVWIDYTLSRRQQGPCSYGNPIIINEMKLRK